MVPQACQYNFSYRRIMLKKSIVVLVFQNEWYFINYSSAEVRLHPK